MKAYRLKRQMCMMMYGQDDINEYIVGMAHYVKGEYSNFFIELYNQLLNERKYKDWINEMEKTYNDVTDLIELKPKK